MRLGNVAGALFPYQQFDIRLHVRQEPERRRGLSGPGLEDRLRSRGVVFYLVVPCSRRDA